MKALIASTARVLLCLTFLVAFVCGQETTGGLQGTVKDSTGAVVAGAKVVLTGPGLVGSKEATSDGNGYYRFANLPPAVYTVTITTKGFTTLKRDNVAIEVGHLPTLDLALQVGGSETVVEVTESAPLIDVTTTRTMTNVTEDVLADVPHGRSFQSVIQFAPSARNEPLMAASLYGAATGGTGGSLPGSSGNGGGVGYSVGGASDSENSYLVEGQDTENISGGYSKANVPYQFIQEVQIKTSGIEAEHGGSIGGVANVVMKKGSNAWHGELFGTWEGSSLDGNNNGQYLRYDALNSYQTASGDPDPQIYSGIKDKYHIIQPGGTIGGPIVKDKLWLFLGFAPQYSATSRTVNFGAFPQFSSDPTAGAQLFTQDLQQYYSTARLDYAMSQKVRLFASWLYQYGRETGASLPVEDPVAQEAQAGFINSRGILAPIAQFSHGIGWSAPNSTYNFGADVTLTDKIVATTRFGYFFENYHDFGWPTTAPDLNWATPGVGLGGIPQSLQQPIGTNSQPFDASYTVYNSNKHYQFDQDVAFFKSGWWGTHNFKFGYQLNHLVNLINQNGNVPFANLILGSSYSPFTTTGAANCAALAAEWGACTGQYGYLQVVDFATIEPKPASDWNHGFFAQDAWTVGHGITINAGIRVEKESLPAPTGVNIRTIDFGWGDKIAPRVGIAWDPLQNGKMKIFGSYGVFNDVMKLLVAETSFGAQVYEECNYPLGPNGQASGFNVSDINLQFVNNRACPSASPTTGANFAGGVTPPNLVDAGTDVSLIENINLRPYEPVVPGLKPYRQHESVVGVDYELSKNWAFEARWDRRRLDHVIEDASLASPAWGEIYTIVNPGEGANSTINGYSNFLGSLGQGFGFPGMEFDPSLFGTCSNCPANPKAIRDYDGVEFRLTKAASNGLAGMFSYTWSRLWGNYTGLTTTDQADGGTTGRNSPDTTRAFDEPFMYFTAQGKSNAGPLPTDRPNALKGYAYYQLPWGKGHGMATTFGIFQTAYEGTPISSFVDLGTMFGQEVSEGVDVFGRGKYANITVDPTTGQFTFGQPYTLRTPWYTQTDANFVQTFKVNKHNERQEVGFELNVLNLWNQHSVTNIYGGMNSTNQPSPALPGGLPLYAGAATYQAYETGYNLQQALQAGGTKASSWYGLPFSYQLARTMRFTLRYSF
ncbi:MAG TPA: TonB-dependent receptor [Candidatus Koribacter sp.]|jgi:hypothetical protein